MHKLEPHNQFPITKENIAQILDAYAISDFAFEPMVEGIENTSLKITSGGKQYILRIYQYGKKSDERVRFQIDFQNYMTANDIPVPTVMPNQQGDTLTIADIQGKRWQVILMDFVEGQSVTARPSKELVAELARIHARMHLLGAEYPSRVSAPKNHWIDLHDSFAARVGRDTFDDKEVADFLDRVTAFKYVLNPALPHGFNHLDVDFDGNVITNGDTVQAIIDFDDLEYSPTIVCLGYSLWSVLSDQGFEAANEYLRTYEEVRPLAAIERETLVHVLFFRNYVIGVIRLLLWPEKRSSKDIETILRLEREIPVLRF